MSEKIGIPFYGYLDMEDTEDMLRKQNEILQREINRLNAEAMTLRNKLKELKDD
jgi:chaperonin cofactor prefoldin